MKEVYARAVGAKTRDEWVAAAEGVEACIAPVLEPDEVADDPHLAAREAFVRHHDILQPAPAPRFSRTPAALSHRPPLPGEHTADALADWGFGEDEVAGLRQRGAVGGPVGEPAR
jgi:alpha-methylacyl-CoA racemase